MEVYFILTTDPHQLSMYKEDAFAYLLFWDSYDFVRWPPLLLNYIEVHVFYFAKMIELSKICNCLSRIHRFVW